MFFCRYMQAPDVIKSPQSLGSAAERSDERNYPKKCTAKAPKRAAHKSLPRDLRGYFNCFCSPGGEKEVFLETFSEYNWRTITGTELQVLTPSLVDLFLNFSQVRFMNGSAKK